MDEDGRDALVFWLICLADRRQSSFAVFVSVSNFDFLEEEGFRRLGRGKVREVFETFESDRMPKDRILIAATDCISAFDKVLPNSEIRGKGIVLTKMSDFWFQKTESIAPNHRQGIHGEHWPEKLDPTDGRVKGRVVVVHRAKPLPIECVVRGFLAGSGWKEYQRTGSVCGTKLPSGLRESAELQEPIFTPSTKAKAGHDENIAFEDVGKLCGEETAEQVRDYSLKLYKRAREFAQTKGILIADTKFEFGYAKDGELMLIDEALTPDSSRFWPAEKYQPGISQESFDKQIVRDYLEKTGWDKKSPSPKLPREVAEKTRSRYLEIYERLTGESLENG